MLINYETHLSYIKYICAYLLLVNWRFENSIEYMKVAENRMPYLTVDVSSTV